MKKNNFYHLLPSDAKTDNMYLWEMDKIPPFREITLGWNALRPTSHAYHFTLSLKVDHSWSPWCSYAYWGVNDQKSFSHQTEDIQILQDTVVIKEGKSASGWRLKIEIDSPSNLQDFKAFYATIPCMHKTSSITNQSHINLPIPPISQLTIEDDRCRRICSPTSTSAVLQYLQQNNHVTPLAFADKVWDSNSDIYGHWVFAAAQAFVELGDEWIVKVSYLTNFNELYLYLKKGFPVVVSVKGTLPGSMQSYDQGHLIVVNGFDPKENKVLCMDPAYPTDAQTSVTYPLNDFLSCWYRRKNVAYTFEKEN